MITINVNIDTKIYFDYFLVEIDHNSDFLKWLLDRQYNVTISLNGYNEFILYLKNGKLNLAWKHNEISEVFKQAKEYVGWVIL